MMLNDVNSNQKYLVS